MPDNPMPLLPQLLERIPHHILCRFRMEGDTGDTGDTGAQPPAGQGQGQGAPAERMLSQSEVDRIVQDRVAREKAKYADYDDLKARAASTLTEHERALEQAKKDAETAARTDERSKATSRILSAEIKAAAGGRFADPGDVVRLLDLSQFTVDDDGNVDAKAVTKALDQLLESKPYLAAGAQPPRRPGPPNLAQGARGAEPKVDGNDWLRNMAARARG